jgi:hypothetical protein
VTPAQAIAFVEKHGIVLERARGAVPCLVDAIVGERVKGSWWAHPKAHHVFRVLGAVADSPDVLRCRLVDDKITYVHRRVWPALVRLAGRIGERRLDRHDQEHTETGRHRTVTTRYPSWVPRDAALAAKKLEEDDALAILAPFAPEK